MKPFNSNTSARRADGTHRTIRRSLLATAALAALTVGALGSLPAPALAQAGEWPQRPIKLIIPYPPGGLTDIVSRTVSDEVARILGQPVILENRAGAGGQIGLQAMMQAPRDGYTIGLVVPATMITLPLTNPDYPFRPQRDFEPITIAVSTYLSLVVSPALGVKNVKEFAALASKNPGKFNYGTPGIGTSFHFNNVLMGEKLGVRGVHVPYNGEIKILSDIVGGQLHYALASNAAKPFIDGGKLIPIAVTSARRVTALPNVPTFREQGVDFVSDGWVGYIAAQGTPAPILDKLNAAFIKAMAVPKIEKLYTDMGYLVVGSSRKEFSAEVEAGSKRYEAMIRTGAVQLDKK